MAGEFEKKTTAGYIVKASLGFLFAPLTSLYGFGKGLIFFLAATISGNRYFHTIPDRYKYPTAKYDVRAKFSSAAYGLSRTFGLAAGIFSLIFLFGVLVLPVFFPFLTPLYAAGFAKGIAALAFWKSLGNVLLISGIATIAGRGLGAIVGSAIDFFVIHNKLANMMVVESWTEKATRFKHWLINKFERQAVLESVKSNENNVTKKSIYTYSTGQLMKKFGIQALELTFVGEAAHSWSSSKDRASPKPAASTDSSHTSTHSPSEGKSGSRYSSLGR